MRNIRCILAHVVQGRITLMGVRGLKVLLSLRTAHKKVFDVVLFNEYLLLILLYR